ncbi:MAG: leucyl/phenylalanyl-tRNA--protein transferase [Pseudomonadota bacterium]
MVDFVSFPPLSSATEDGLLAMGGELNLNTLVSAYSQGIFPWFNHDQPILWWSPDPRLILYPDEMKVSRSLRKVLRQNRFTVTCDRAFAEVIKGCAIRGSNKPFTPMPETWITDDMHRAYVDLFEHGYAHSIEVWLGNRLVGGLYGVVLGKVFFGESMFSEVSNASKVAMAALCNWLRQRDFAVIDCQVASDHLFTLGAREIPRDDFMQYLQDVEIGQSSHHFGADFTCHFP